MLQHQIESKLEENMAAKMMGQFFPNDTLNKIQEATDSIHNNESMVNPINDYESIAKKIENRLGGPFDYHSFNTDLNEITSGKGDLLKNFREGALPAPPVAP